MLIDEKKCYLCGGMEFNKRPGSVRDNTELEILECASCELVFLSSFDHIKDAFYENSEMHGEEMPDTQAWLRETAWNDERRFQYIKQVLPNRRLLDFGCGAGGFLFMVATAHKDFGSAYDTGWAEDELYQAGSKISAGQSPLLAGEWQTRRSSKMAFP